MTELSFRAATDKDLNICAGIISTSEAWTTFGINYDKAIELLTEMEDKIYIAEISNNIVGFNYERA